MRKHHIATAQRICKLQGIEIKVEIPVLCPFCEVKKARIKGQRWECSCGKGGTIEELEILAREDYMGKRPKAYWESRTNKGVCK
ncbi:hypothetical protein [Halonatronum saccharophilum]|uniref:hypothetical protein n=1 Tax=Halonatronum saccharophilum TaxID=150060 RepID=UPI000487C9C8|nr:hypothetical protein [Halonatronum saccharophilum]